ncbi:hypothetical protein M405DRAFT_480981 [Rhizopogon salebrosus TDB-379]|nr:hypothetical protein M405DRAFT_480981 [Rhizopogon salebrosus TDB-379]
MSLNKAWPLILVAVLVVAPKGVFPQLTGATCLPSFNWMENTLNQNPCNISSYLVSACLNYTLVIVDVYPPGTMYTGPTADTANDCLCNTVTYSMLSACGACQGSPFENWSDWKVNCTIPYNMTYPRNIPNDTVVPHWAYLDVVTSNRFNVTAAEQAGDAPESSAPVPSTSSIILPTTNVSASLTTSSTSATASSSPTSTSKSLNVGAVAGGVVGGVVIGVIASVAAWFFVRRRRSKIAPSKAFSDTSGNTQSVYSTHANQFPIMRQQPPLYDPSNPSTFPATPPAVPPTSSTNIYPNSSIPSHVYSQPSRPGQYSGAPEV